MGSSRFAPRPKHKRALSDDMFLSPFVQTVEIGTPGSLEYRVLYGDDRWQRQLSPWHDIPLRTDGNFVSCICKTPAGSWARHEAAADEPFNPLRLVKSYRDIKEGAKEDRRSRPLDAQLVAEEIAPTTTERRAGSGRLLPIPSLLGLEDKEVKDSRESTQSARPAHYPDNAPWNIGCLPQTWTKWASVGEEADQPGMLEVIDIGLCKLRQVGEVYLVKPLGAFRVEDRGAGACWRVVVIAADDAMAELFQDTRDVPLYLPGIWDQIRDWLKTSMAGRKGSKRTGIHVSRPCPAALTRARIAASYEAWRHYSTRQSAVRKSLTLKIPAPLSAAVLATAWKKYTCSDSQSTSTPISLTCPAALSSTFWDPSWSEVQPQKPVVSASTSPSHKGESPALPLRGLLTLWNRVMSSNIARVKPQAKQKPQVLEPASTIFQGPVPGVYHTEGFVQSKACNFDAPDSFHKYCATPGRVEEEEEELFPQLTRSNTEPSSRKDYHAFHVSRTPVPAHWTPAVVFPRRGLRQL